ncbi:hypothetical protein VA7868_04505 [Vibrio aerogenes CECT 7868]|uniref:Uncharacterized protein n=1 Tax=Vibrio aerogenes CECT 7868 TaxID=1216006 RepID=A0A1M6EQZ7_9VIBR|nr:DNA-processing protein DprA [Vibrio aerogenes]SHI87863.1 hypothetical protein VA7868_04505 [Vibrio aerogenes CECT 7868]
MSLHSDSEAENELLFWIKLSTIPRLGIKGLQKILLHDSLSSLSRYTPGEWLHLGLKPEQVQYLTSGANKAAEACLKWRNRSENRFILPYYAPDYPALLKETVGAPPLLFVLGNTEVLSLPQIAIVGSRAASHPGRQDAWHFANEFVSHGLVVTSGLAIGIDGHAHDGALKGGGQTVAVLGTGLDHIYPSRHRQLAQRMIESGGALVSEFCPAAPPKPKNFPRRNRIISGMSVGVVVIEAAEKSGSLITAKYAAEQNRDVFVIPGSIHQAGYRGSNQLIRSGASLVLNPRQVMEEVGTLSSWTIDQKKNQQSELFPPFNVDKELPFAELLANVGVEATPVDILATRTNIPVHEVMRQLLDLELSGHVVAVAGGYIRKGRG